MRAAQRKAEQQLRREAQKAEREINRGPGSATDAAVRSAPIERRWSSSPCMAGVVPSDVSMAALRHSAPRQPVLQAVAVGERQLAHAPGLRAVVAVDAHVVAHSGRDGDGDHDQHEESRLGIAHDHGGSPRPRAATTARARLRFIRRPLGGAPEKLGRRDPDVADP
jgi:hypothetical protein